MVGPAVSAIVNTYNRAALLSRALASILAQKDAPDFEVLVVHDGPADDATVAVAKRYDDLFTRAAIPFRFFSMDENSGYQCVPKNVATWHARGDYIAYLDDDNEWTDDHLRVLFDAIEEGTVWPDFVYGRRLYIDDRSDEQKVLRPLYEGESPFVPFTDSAKERLGDAAQKNFIDTSDVLLTRGAMWRLQLATDMMWNEKVRRFGDWELFTRGVFFSGWRGKGIDHIVQRYHWHGENLQLTRAVHETPRSVSL